MKKQFLIEDTNKVIEPLSHNNIGILYFSLEETKNILGIGKTKLYKDYINNDNFSIKPYNLEGTKKVFFYLEDINEIKQGRYDNTIEKRSEATITIKEKEVAVDSNSADIDIAKLQADYNSSIKELKKCEEIIAILKKSNEDITGALEKSQSLLSREQELNAKDKNVILSLTNQLEESKIKQIALTEEDAALKTTLVSKEEENEKLIKEIKSKESELKELENKLNEIRDKNIWQLIKFKFKKH